VKKTTIVISLLTLILIAAGGLWYWNYTRSPEYSLLKIREAIGQHDVDLFEKHVDVAGVTSSLIDQLMSQMNEESGAQGLGGALAQGLIGLMKPRLTDALKEQILNAVETGSFEQESGGQEASADSDFSLTNILESGSGTEFEGIDQVTKEGKIAYVGLKLRPKDPKQNTILILNVKMRDRGGYWQVAELTNADKIIDQLRGPEKQIAANESSAISMVRNIITSQITYSATAGRGNYASDLAALIDLGLIAVDIKPDGAGEYYGYRIRTTSENGNTFTVGADPIVPGETGKRHFFSDESGVMRWSIEGPATSTSPPLGQ